MRGKVKIRKENHCDGCGKLIPKGKAWFSEEDDLVYCSECVPGAGDDDEDEDEET